MIRDRIWTRHFVALSLGSFFMFLTFYMLATAFPLYVKEGLHGNQQQMGLAMTVFVIGSVLIRLFSGQWVDRFGKQRMAVIGMIVFLLACIGYFGTPGIMLFLVVRFVHGMGYALASTATSTIAAALVPESRQGEGIGYFSMFMSIAMVAGPALGLLLWGDRHIHHLLLAICAFAVLSLLLTAVVRMPERSGPQAANMAAPVQFREEKGWCRLIEPKALPISLVGMFLGISYSSLPAFMSVYASEIHQSQTTGAFFVAFAAMIILCRPLIGRIFDRYPAHYLFYPGAGLFAAGLFMLSQAHAPVTILGAGVVMGAGYGALLPCCQTLALKLSPPHRKGKATGTFFLLFETGYGIGSYMMGVIASYTDYRMMYASAAVIAVLCAAVYYQLYHRPGEKPALPKVNMPV
ncbi:MFS transporter [Paenibacillus sp. R14(2021)]|uniref:MFS transporter n=1 Tax=Paenibacillus sp. R14(2021) TaxID=2859228 RepID=UPI001C613CCB|nr:MFS transporter [Paenibacillus sp. R14(2021)]